MLKITQLGGGGNTELRFALSLICWASSRGQQTWPGATAHLPRLCAPGHRNSRARSLAPCPELLAPRGPGCAAATGRARAAAPSSPQSRGFYSRSSQTLVLFAPDPVLLRTLPAQPHLMAFHLCRFLRGVGEEPFYLPNTTEPTWGQGPPPPPLMPAVKASFRTDWARLGDQAAGRSALSADSSHGAGTEQARRRRQRGWTAASFTPVTGRSTLPGADQQMPGLPSPPWGNPGSQEVSLPGPDSRHCRPPPSLISWLHPAPQGALAHLSSSPG